MVPEYSPQRGNPSKGFGPRGFLMVYCNTTVTILAKMLLPNQRRIQYKVTFFTREVTFFLSSTCRMSACRFFAQTGVDKKMSCRLECLNDTTFDDMSGNSRHVGNFLIVV